MVSFSVLCFIGRLSLLNHFYSNLKEYFTQKLSLFIHYGVIPDLQYVLLFISVEHRGEIFFVLLFIHKQKQKFSM